MPKITPFLWFDDNAEEAVDFYVSLYKNSEITSVSRYGEEGPGPAGTVMMMTFTIDGQEFMALNGGPVFTFSSATSFFVHCETQEEVDHLWNNLSAGGEEQDCGWVKDRFGVTWQIVPTILGELMQSQDAKKVQNMVKAMLKMKKLDIQGLKQAYEQG
jgi:predicted 3-demethylubiquinone-9 3-methyltransferase (glyoxalase superfamily)